MQVEIKAVKKSQVVEWTVLYPTRVRRAKVDRKSTRLNSSHSQQSRMPSSA